MQFQVTSKLLNTQISVDAPSIKNAVSHICETIIPHVQEYLRRISLSQENSKCESNKDKKAFQSIIHVSGTKRKGSTFSLVESALRWIYGQHTGLYSSLHLVEVTERIRLDGQPISEEEYAEAYTTLRNLLSNHDHCWQKGKNDRSKVTIKWLEINGQ